MAYVTPLGVETYVMCKYDAWLHKVLRKTGDRRMIEHEDSDDEKEVLVILDMAHDFLNEETDGTALYEYLKDHRWKGTYPVKDWLKSYVHYDGDRKGGQ